MPRMRWTEGLLSEGWPGVLTASLVRDMRIAISYRIGFLISTGGAIVSILSVFFLSEAFGTDQVGPLQAYGGSYFGFAVIGVAMSNLMALGLAGIASTIREGQMTGTLELMLLSPNRLGILLFGSSIWGHAQALITLALYVIAGLVLGLDLGSANVPMALASLALAIVAFNALGLLSASVVIVIKQGNPVSLLVGMASVLLGGVLYPVSVLPGWLQAAGQALPLTHALELLRRSLLGGEGIGTLWGQFLALLVLTAVLLPLGLFACDRAVRFAQTDGSLSQY